MALTQAESYADLWAAHRDQSRPVTPADVWGLREDRAFQPPSKAHRKRLARHRPDVTVAPPRPDVLSASRIAVNVAQKHGTAIKRQLGIVPYVARPAERSHREHGKAVPLTDDMRKRRFDQHIAEAIRLVRIARAMKHGAARNDVLRRATYQLRSA